MEEVFKWSLDHWVIRSLVVVRERLRMTYRGTPIDLMTIDFNDY